MTRLRPRDLAVIAAGALTVWPLVHPRPLAPVLGQTAWWRALQGRPAPALPERPHCADCPHPDHQHSRKPGRGCTARACLCLETPETIRAGVTPAQ